MSPDLYYGSEMPQAFLQRTSHLPDDTPVLVHGTNPLLVFQQSPGPIAIPLGDIRRYLILDTMFARPPTSGGL